MNYINPYNYKPNPVFNKAPLEPDTTKLFMGVELETDSYYRNYDSIDEYSTDLRNLDKQEKLFYQKHDGSLMHGIEIVTHPATLDFHLNWFPWAEICNLAKQYEFTRGDTCGLHVHVSREAFGSEPVQQELNIAKVLILVNAFWNQIVTFTRRDKQHLKRWASKSSIKIYSDEKQNSILDKENRIRRYTRYTAVNLRNRSTVEFRIFKGTLDPEQIRATLEFVHNLIGYACATDVKVIQKTNWKNIVHFVDYPDLNAYLTKLDLDISKKCGSVIRPPVNIIKLKNDVPTYIDGQLNPEAYEIVTMPASEFEDNGGLPFVNGDFVAVLSGRSKKKFVKFAKVIHRTPAGNIKLDDGQRAYAPSRIAHIEMESDLPTEIDLSYTRYAKIGNEYYAVFNRENRNNKFFWIFAHKRSYCNYEYIIMTNIGDTEIKTIKEGQKIKFYDTPMVITDIVLDHLHLVDSYNRHLSVRMADIGTIFRVDEEDAAA